MTTTAIAGKQTPLISSFNAGELSPKLDARVDLEKYYSGCRTLENMVAHPYGAATRRPGFKYVADVRYEDRFTRLVPFEFSTTQAYVLEFGHEYIRVYKDGGQVGSEDANTDLLLHFDGENYSTTITDDGDTGHSPSANGYARVYTGDVQFGSGSLIVTETGSYVSVADHADWNFGSSEFTIEAWINFYDSTAVTGIAPLIYQADATTGDHIMVWQDHVLGELRLLVTDSSGAKQVNIAGDWSPSSDTWYHVAVIRGWGSVTNSWALCVGGDTIATTTDTSAMPDHDQALNIGNPSIATTTIFDISNETRVATCQGDAKRMSIGDLGVASGYGADGGTNTGALYFDGTGDYITVPDSVDFRLIDSTRTTWTLECWVYIDSKGSADQYIFSHGDSNGGDIWSLRYDYGLDEFRFSHITSTVHGGTVVEAQWHHVCVVRADGYIALYVDGEQVDNNVYSRNYPTSSDLHIGCQYHTRLGNRLFFDGYIDNLRIAHTNVYSADTDNSSDTISYSTTLPPTPDATNDKLYLRSETYSPRFLMDECRISKGVARWTAAFTPPTEPYPYSGGAGGGTIYTLTTTYQEADIPYLQYAQSADTMWIVHPTYKPQKLTRTAHDNWSISNYAPTADPFTSADNYPSTVAFYEERLWFAATNTNPQTLYSSKAGDFDDMTTGSNDDDAIEITLAADQVNVIRWLSPGKFLHIGTVGGEWRIGSDTGNDPVTPSNVQARRDTEYGSAWRMPIRIGGSIIFIQRAKRNIREIAYKFEDDAYRATDLTVLADHITEGQVEYLEYQQNPNSTLWAVKGTGDLIGLTYLKEHDVYAWHDHHIGGTDADVESIAIIPSDDEVWIVAKRTIDDDTVRYIEQLQPFFDGDSIEDAFFVDSGLTYDGTATTSISGLDHLEGESVAVLADGVNITGKTVSSGAISLTTAASTVHIGLGYTSIVEPMKLNVGHELGTARGKKQRIHKILAAFYETGDGVEYGPDTSNLKDITGFTSGSLTTDDLTEIWHDGFDTALTIVIQQADPLPMTLMGLVPWVTLNEE
jgi:hypothetical protein